MYLYGKNAEVWDLRSTTKLASTYLLWANNKEEEKARKLKGEYEEQVLTYDPSGTNDGKITQNIVEQRNRQIKKIDLYRSMIKTRC